jgi:hypothetical protein
MARARAKPNPGEVERRLFEFSLGPLRLLDTVLEKAGHGKHAGLLRNLLVEWRAYPSLTVFSRKDLLGFAATLGRIEAGLLRAGQEAAAGHVAGIKGEIEGWTQRPNRS